MTFLNLENNYLKNSGATALAEALKNNTSLTYLDLGTNQIGDLGATTLAAALKSNTTLASLNLRENHIGALGATGLAEALKNNTSLIFLNLEENQIGDSGATDLAEALKSNVTLTSFYLGNNEIEDSGATALAKALKSNSTLTFLDLTWNQIGDSGATDFAEALESNATLTSLTLENNTIGDPGATAFAKALKSNFSLTSCIINPIFSIHPHFYDIHTATVFYLRRNKNRIAQATEYLTTSFVEKVTQETNLPSPLTNIIGDYLIPHDLLSKCDITGSAAGMNQFGMYADPYSEKKMKWLQNNLCVLLSSDIWSQDLNSKEIIYVNLRGYTLEQRFTIREIFTSFFEKYYTGRDKQDIPTADLPADENDCRLIIKDISLEGLSKILYDPHLKEEVAPQEESPRNSYF